MSLSNGKAIASSIRNLIQTMINTNPPATRDVALKELEDAIDSALISNSDNDVAICKVYKGVEGDKEHHNLKHYSRARLPEKAFTTDSGFDAFVCIDDETIISKFDDDETKATITIDPGKTRIIPLGISIKLPEGYEIQCRGKSGFDSKDINVRLGTCDEGYAGVYKAVVKNNTNTVLTLKHGQKIAQLVVAKKAKAIMEWGREDSISTDTDRGEGGFGSTGL